MRDFPCLFEPPSAFLSRSEPSSFRHHQGPLSTSWAGATINFLGWDADVDPGACTILGCVHKLSKQIGPSPCDLLQSYNSAIWSLRGGRLRKCFLLPAAGWWHHLSLAKVTGLEHSDDFLMIKGAAFFFLRNDTIIYCDTSRILVILRPPFTYCVEGRFTRDFACCIRPPPLTWLGWLYECLSLKKRDADPFRAGKLHAILRLAATVAQQSQ